MNTFAKSSPGDRKMRVELDRPFVETDRLLQWIDRQQAFAFRRQSAQISVVSLRIARWFERQRLLLMVGEFCL